MTVDYLIVGAGLSGCVFAERIASQMNKSVLLIEKREHIGGNCYDFYNNEGILIHKYGPHWFHTNNKRIFDYLSLFTKWRIHEHKVRSNINGKLYPFPINRDTINQLYGTSLTSIDQMKEYYNSVKAKGIKKAHNAEEIITSQIGWDLYNKFYKNYTIKQWAIDPIHLDASITSRIPIRYDTDDRYFTDNFQGLPENGYTEMLKNMTSSKNIDIILNTDFKKVIKFLSFKKMIYTGSVDHYFDYQFGVLPYRSLRFEHETLNQEYFQPFQQINYPNDFNFTRIIEWKHATGQKHQRTTITREYPCMADDKNEKLYPIITKENLELAKKYANEVAKLKNIFFCGRLAEYKYFNMDQVIGRALSIFNKQLSA